MMDNQLQRLLFPLGIALGSSFILLLIRGLSFKYLAKWAEKSATRVESAVISGLRAPSFYWVFAIALYIGIALADLQEKYAKPLYQAITSILILSIAVAIANLAGAVFRNLMQKGTSAQTSGLAVGLVKMVVVAIGVLIILSLLGISVTPLLTALGVGGLAVALALKDTLENLFAGLYLLTDRTIRVGDYIKLENGQEGLIQDIGWRSTRIKTLNHNTAILPNSKIAQSLVTNYCLPEEKLAVSIPLSVVCTDPDKIESVLVDIVKKGSEDIAGLLSYPIPAVRFAPGLGENAIEATLSFCVTDFPAQFFVKHELVKRIFQRFQKEGIAFPQKIVSAVQTVEKAPNGK